MKLHRPAAAGTLMLLLGSTLSAQETRTLRGTVADLRGTPLEGAEVADPSGRWRVVTGPSGTFHIQLPAEVTRLVASRILHRPDTVALGADGDVAFRLAGAPLSLEGLTVSGGPLRATASSLAIREVDVQLRPRESSQELLRLAPGLVIAQHAGGGKAEQIFLRGMDADHGTDVAVSVDGLPVNMVSHAHGQGYADLHFVIPELVERVEVRKGPFDARDGDFATAGAVELRTRERLPAGMVRTRLGSFGTAQLVAATPLGGGAGEAGGYVAAAGLHSDGPFELPQNHGRVNLFGKWTAPLGRAGEWFAQASAFGARWDASGQIPVREVEAGRIGRFGAVDPTEGGVTTRSDLTAGVRSVAGGEAQWEAQLFATRYAFRLFSNFTFFLNDPESGDGIEQVDDRRVAGLRGAYRRANEVAGLPGEWRMGAATRSDRADVALHHQTARVRLRPRVDDRISQDHLSAWADQELVLSARTRLRVGLRGDLFRFGVLDRLVGIETELPHASGTVWKGVVSPRSTLALDVGARTTLFASAGGGFHSNDARDVVLAAPGDEVLPRAWSGELGARSVWRGGSVAAAVWAMALESELVYVGDEGATEASGRTRRMGVDLEGRARLLPWLWADADVNLSRGRFPDEPPGEDFIPLAPAVTSTAGLTARDVGAARGGVRFRQIGTRPADESGSIRAYGYTVWELFGSYAIGPVEISATVDNLLDAVWNEAQFATTSRLHHEPNEVTELHFTPGAPRSVQIGVTYRFGETPRR